MEPWRLMCQLKFRYRTLESFLLYVMLTRVSLSNLHKFEFGELDCVFFKEFSFPYSLTDNDSSLVWSKEHDFSKTFFF